MENYCEGLKNKMSKSKMKHVYQCGDIVCECWQPLGKSLKITGRYIIYDKKDVWCEISQLGYTLYKAWNLYHRNTTFEDTTHQYPLPLKAGKTRTITVWSEDSVESEMNSTWKIIYKSGLSWGEGKSERGKE